MNAYISVSFNRRKQLDMEIMSIIESLRSFEIGPFVFVDKFKFDVNEEKEMMSEAMKAIDNADLLIAETSHKGIGIGVEVGYAKAKSKPVIYVRNKNAEHSTTVSGISDFEIVYNNPSDLKQQLTNTLFIILNSSK